MQSAEWYRERVSAPSLSDADKSVIRADWKQATGKNFTASFNARCPNCHHDAAILILRTMNKQENGGKSWLNPYSEVAQMYIADLSLECVRAGCSAIMLDGGQFPAEWYISQDLKHRDDFEVLAKDYDEYDIVSFNRKEE